MITYIALFRGINVGGSNILPMKELVAHLDNLGCENVRTYIQSGNAVFRHKEKNASRVSKRISTAIRESHGFDPYIHILTLDQLTRAMTSNPFPDAEADPSMLHLVFLASVPKHPGLDALESVKTENERFALKSDIFYLHAPDGIGRSKLAARMERALGIAATVRNWRSVCKILDMARRCG